MHIYASCLAILSWNYHTSYPSGAPPPVCIHLLFSPAGLRPLFEIRIAWKTDDETLITDDALRRVPFGALVPVSESLLMILHLFLDPASSCLRTRSLI